MTPSLSSRQVPVSQDLCVSCIAAAAAAALINTIDTTPDSKTDKSIVDEQIVSESKQVLSSSRDNDNCVQVQYSDSL